MTGEVKDFKQPSFYQSIQPVQKKMLSRSHILFVRACDTIQYTCNTPSDTERIQMWATMSDFGEKNGEILTNPYESLLLPNTP